MLYVDLFCASLCPKVIASLPYAVVAYERLQWNALLSDSWGNLQLLSSVFPPCHLTL